MSSMIPGIAERYRPRFSGVYESGIRNVFSAQAGEANFDPSRLNCKEYLVSADFTEAIVREIDGLLALGKSGFAPLLIADRTKEPYRRRTTVKSTLLVRWKGPTKANAMLCIRGDMLSIRDKVRAHTPFRSAVETSLFLPMSCNIRIAQIDISQALLQEDITRDKDQLAVGPPECIELHCKSLVLGGDS